MLGKMMYQPLLISGLIEHAARYHGDTAVLSKEVDGVLSQITQNDWPMRWLHWDLNHQNA